MEGFETTDLCDSLLEFTLAEIMEMESLFKEVGEEQLCQKFFEKIANKFSCSTYRAAKPAITWEQVQSWFQDKQNELSDRFTSSPVASVDFLAAANQIKSNNASKSSQKSRGERIAELSELVFEAKSSKDDAWYDVAAFLNYRVLSSGELEARVRFAGFKHDEDEWVNVKRAVRERSIPLEPSECHKVKVGDVVLCFRENDDHALYSDAHILEIQRRIHDIRGCRCIFVVRYEYDNTEEKVQLTRLCARPA